ncbi:type II toxin-antitoxin system RelE family toxin [Ferroplasma acidiphilum]|uniref:type II toxin-antitoxin system RelE family toxin n=1 Tax=Ferroplasma acidiphilum TaxID=74969 RepID=UPI002814E39A|nr:type II toxin-antitoxin system RelE/ParE family toxin [Ferroplasma acidiphilum]WMT52615.1 MAG: type II toxin-antitoxin system RelE/ParE family toxin [Ferroplasma acidiphilum]
MTFEIVLTDEAENFIKKCDKDIRNRILKSLRRLEDDPEIGKPLTSILTGLWSLRIGDYRAIYQIKNNKLTVVVIKIGHRKNVY